MRARFTLAEVRAQAIQIVDKDGLAGLSMRSLAAALGTGPMTLYNYVKDREELEGLVAEAVLADVRLPRRSDDWHADVKAVATAIWRGVRQHPNAAPLVLTRRAVSAVGYLPAERLVEALRRAGLSDLDALAAFRAVLSLVMGAAQVELAGPLAAADREQSNAAIAQRIGDLAGAEHPHLAALAETSQRSTMGDDFDRALDMLLTGIQAAATKRRR
ncbi:TetR/AcrR family transcriptional regulator C-terminal domain-containing protein [Mycobacterium sp. Aquia_216]|uniref:TetR/AcrR family transcriptional regulator C-terminal domain-containing protein n=1 Tax=Mycobacterium sp. Aquia_216 TaxID=2991729 RepID=UPI00227A898E|nr:TetR/AcrR family transcriptional regulator C-terminal domain-containing protein [Mycobacterium sp. Aquia_216]WAJ45011.1 TetR/AcrR family transcriptional regulator C-terminal domain-containing protein [Mycobacterium sp. Aquia_216]